MAKAKKISVKVPLLCYFFKQALHQNKNCHRNWKALIPYSHLYGKNNFYHEKNA